MALFLHREHSALFYPLPFLRRATPITSVMCIWMEIAAAPFLESTRRRSKFMNNSFIIRPTRVSSGIIQCMCVYAIHQQAPVRCLLCCYFVNFLANSSPPRTHIERICARPKMPTPTTTNCRRTKRVLCSWWCFCVSDCIVGTLLSRTFYLYLYIYSAAEISNKVNKIRLNL